MSNYINVVIKPFIFLFYIICMMGMILSMPFFLIYKQLTDKKNLTRYFYSKLTKNLNNQLYHALFHGKFKLADKLLERGAILDACHDLCVNGNNGVFNIKLAKYYFYNKKISDFSDEEIIKLSYFFCEHDELELCEYICQEKLSYNKFLNLTYHILRSENVKKIKKWCNDIKINEDKYQKLYFNLYESVRLNDLNHFKLMIAQGANFTHDNYKIFYLCSKYERHEFLAHIFSLIKHPELTNHYMTPEVDFYLNKQKLFDDLNKLPSSPTQYKIKI